MHYRRLGRSGLKVSEIALGTWVTFGGQVKEKGAKELVHSAYDQGVNFFDCADVYSDGQAEVLLGKAVKDLPREGLVISSKVFWPTLPGTNGRGLSRKHIREALHASLRRLDVEYIDMYYCHRYDPDTPIEEVVQTMNDLIHQGLVLYWGTSEWEPHQIAQAYGVARQYGMIPPAMELTQYNLFRRTRVEDELPSLCREFGLGLTTCSPLYFGLLSGKYNEGVPSGSRATLTEMTWINDQMTESRMDCVRQFTALAQELEITTAQLAIGWVLRRKDVNCVITGVSHPEQLDENLEAPAALGMLNDEILENIDRILDTHLGIT
jgi:voltage-dependent potassium channel beta subunit